MKRDVLAAALGLTAAAALVWGEVETWRASRQLVRTDPGGSEAVVVLGFRDRGTHRANALNRWRVRAALRSVDPRATWSRLVFCGTSHGDGRPSEAELMARYATGERGWSGPLVLDRTSRTTWENVENAIGEIEDADRIKIVSNSHHALRARIYLAHQRADLAARLCRAADYRPGEWTVLKPLFALHGLRHLAGIERKLPPAR